MFSRRSVIVSQIVLTVLAVLFAIPLVIMFKVSLQGEGIRNYVAVLTHPLIPRFFLNSLIVSSCTVAIVFVSTLLSAYAFSKLNMPAKSILYNAVLVGLMIPAIALIVPLFLTIKNFGLLNNYFALIGPLSALLIPFTLVLCRNFFDEIPDSLLEAARIDGCGSFKTLLYVMLPLSKPIATVIVIWSFLQSWNEYLLGLVFMQKETMQIVTQAPQFFIGQYTQDTGKIFASLVLISLPVMIAYLLMQKFFEDSMTAGSIKG
jgi:raffinose/stachyose/melibiose transport system permease protein